MPKRHKMPVIFAGHGSPMNAIEDNTFTKEWEKIGNFIGHPESILSISAHWETMDSSVTSMKNPPTIHDFYGFPQELYSINYPAPGSIELAEKISGLIDAKPVQDWGFDHGSWSVLRRMFPDADVPIVQLSLNQSKTPRDQYELAKSLKSLRNEGILIFGSGNVVHNLRMIRWDQSGGFDWANDFNEILKSKLTSRKYEDLVDYNTLGDSVQLSIPTNEHYLPLLYCLAAIDMDDSLEIYNDKLVYGSLSMLGMIWH